MAESFDSNEIIFVIIASKAKQPGHPKTMECVLTHQEAMEEMQEKLKEIYDEIFAGPMTRGKYLELLELSVMNKN